MTPLSQGHSTQESELGEHKVYVQKQEVLWQKGSKKVGEVGSEQEVYNRFQTEWESGQMRFPFT